MRLGCRPPARIVSVLALVLALVQASVQAGETLVCGGSGIGNNATGDLGVLPASTDAARARFLASSIKVSINDVLRATVADSALATATGIGFRGKADTDAESRWGFGDGQTRVLPHRPAGTPNHWHHLR